MAEKLQAVQEQAQNVYGKVYGTAHKTFLAGVGMMAWAQDEIVDLWVHGNEFADKLVVQFLCVGWKLYVPEFHLSANRLCRRRNISHGSLLIRSQNKSRRSPQVGIRCSVYLQVSDPRYL